MQIDNDARNISQNGSKSSLPQTLPQTNLCGDQADLSGELQYSLRELPDNSYKSSAAGYGVVDVGFLRVTIAL